MAKIPATIQQTVEQMKRLVDGLNFLAKDLLPKNPKTFLLMSEGPVDELKKMIQYLEEE